MTSPILALKTEGTTMGRLYQRPGDTFEGELSYEVAVQGLASGRLMPSITNVGGVADKGLDGYKTFMMEQAIRYGWSAEKVILAPDMYRDLTATRGTLVHKFAEDCYDAGILDDWDNPLRDLAFKKLDSWKELVGKSNETIIFNWKHKGIFFIKSFIKFMDEVKPEFTHSEATVYGKTEDGLLYAGTTDFIANINGKTYIGDYKTSSTLSPSTALQLAAVKYSEEITTDFKTLSPMVKASHGLGVNIRADGQYKLYEVDLEAGWSSFQGLRRNWKNKALEGRGLMTEIAL